AIYGILAISLVVLTGWSGQISLGQFAFAGVGAGTAASLFVHAHADLFLCLAAAAAVGASAAVLVGIPALRLSGLFLAVTTLAFAVPVSTFVLNSSYFPGFTPGSLVRPAVLHRFDLNSALTFYYFCLLFLVVALLLTWNYRRSRAARVVLAVRDNARAAASYSVSPARAKLTAFAISGALAGVAGGLYAIGLRGIGFSGYNPENSVQVFIMVVVGGLGSLAGGVIGAVYVQGVQYFLHGAAQLLATGGGVMLVVLALPAGLADLLYRGRDSALRALARSKGLSVPSLAERAAFEPADDGDNVVVEARVDGSPGERTPLVALTGVDAAYGQVQVLFGVHLNVDDGEIVGLLGTNGAGKSTVLRVVSGLLAAKRGQVLFDGKDISGLSAVERVKAGIVLVPSGRGVFPSLTVTENLRLGAWLARKDPAFVESTTERILQLFPVLRMRLSTTASNLSGGEQQMLTIAQALYCRPRVLMIDELSLGLAPSIVSQLLDVVRTLAASGVTIVIVEQSLNVATSIAQRAAFMERGQVRFTGPTADLADRPDLVRAVFLGGPPANGAGSAGRARRARRAGRAGRAGRTERDGTRPEVFAVRDIARRFGGVTALDGVNFGVGRNEILGIIGANGAGKTTLFDICSGFLAPNSGTVSLNGLDVTALAAYERADLGMGRVFQDARLFPSLTVVETVAVALERHIDVRDPF
ncbi:MAG TPA: ATP-binding cassette domain-containing protein, partial [Acidimicrobiales bacterium]|nr:ATP-binding cassette domain-containing protein [Acidimicrobiales bacterium]